jgi:DNA-binding CsgD family transcriptional regulator
MRLNHSRHQLLASVYLQVARLAEDVDPRHRAALDDLRSTLDDVDAQIRRLAHELRPRILGDFGLSDGLYVSPGSSGTGVDASVSRSDVPDEPLTPREREVLQLIAEGNTTKQTAALLGVSVKTAESHRTKMMSKLDIHQTAGLVRYAIRRGLVRI